VQLTESFKLNGQEIERLKKSNKALSIENQKLKEERDGNNDLVNERVQLAAKQAKLIKDVCCLYSSKLNEIKFNNFC
jgi:hypothetical protein